MHGLIHVVFKRFVLEKLGEDLWTATLEQAGVASDAKIFDPIAHSDSVTLALIAAACTVSNDELPLFLESFGEFWVKYITEEGYLTFLQSLGRNMFDFFSNINILHHTVQRESKNAVFPLLEVSHISGDPDGPEHTFRLYYGSGRAGLSTFLLGILKQLAKQLFHCTVTAQDVSSTGPSEMGAGIHVQHVFLVTVVRIPGRAVSAEAASPGRSFFDFHNMLVSLWKCGCTDSQELEEIVIVHPPGVPTEVQRIVKDKQEKIEHIVDVYQQAGACSPSELVDAMTSSDRLRLAAVLFRGVFAQHVATPWTALNSRPEVTGFWDGQASGEMCYTLSKDWLDSSESMALSRNMNGQIVFVSHCWSAPTGWGDSMNTSYPQTKAAEVCSYAKELAGKLFEDPDLWGRVGFWIDKACIPQTDPTLMALCVNLLEEFIALSDGMIVLASWNYFSRLWCVYEWVCGLLIHDAMEIEILADPFVRDSTVATYIKCIRFFSISKCTCNSDKDKQTLIDKVQTYYKSVAHFERFFQFTVIACFVRCLAVRRTGKPSASLQPWTDLARACGFKHLAEATQSLASNINRFQQEATTRARSNSTQDVQAAMSSLIDEWFAEQMAPLISREREAATNHLGVSYIKGLRAVAEDAKRSQLKLGSWSLELADLHQEFRRSRTQTLRLSRSPDSSTSRSFSDSACCMRHSCLHSDPASG
ncbi:unnamed protein product [Effrenium voratum]|uniref:Heme NO-binding domain-containing protein n=1 Tax=Effrenium voratum TaxID=2562239 RepID=A0AA36JSI0_9DINO|nr:unnamed protein product [Effrenium voratum]CAJ1410862.1 unnamed protein product [Effrenium voratum]CAJ1452683.1 unnamed protein product [Effrenium voratum]